MINNVSKSKQFVNVVSISETETDKAKIKKAFIDLSKQDIKYGLYISPQYDFQLISYGTSNIIEQNDYINYCNSINEEIVQLSGEKSNKKIVNSKILNQKQISNIIDDLNGHLNFNIKNPKKKSYFDFIFPMRLIKNENNIGVDDFKKYVMQPIFLVIRIFDISKKVDIPATIEQAKESTNVSFNNSDIKISNFDSNNPDDQYEVFFLQKDNNDLIFYSDIIMYSINQTTDIKNLFYNDDYLKKLSLEKKDANFNHLGFEIKLEKGKVIISNSDNFLIKNKVLTTDVNKKYSELSQKFVINNFFKSVSNNRHIINDENFDNNEILNTLFLSRYLEADVNSFFTDIQNVGGLHKPGVIAAAAANATSGAKEKYINISQLYHELISADESRFSNISLNKNKGQINAWNKTCEIVSDKSNLYSNYFELTNASADLLPAAFSSSGMRGYYVLAKEDYILKMYEGLDVGKKEHQIDLNELYKYIVNNIIKVEVTLL